MEKLIENIGAFGVYQIKEIIILSLNAVIYSMLLYGTIFITAQPKLMCFNNEPSTTLTNNITYFNNTCEIRKNITLNNQINNSLICVFDKKYYGRTIATDWNLYCERKFLSSLTQTIYIAGAVCSIFVGYIGDKYGRKRSVLLFLVLLAISLLISQILLLEQLNLSVNFSYIIYCITQCLFGAASVCLVSSSFVLLLEFTVTANHNKFSIIKWCFCTFGELIIMIIAYLTRDWRIINWVVLGIIFFVFILIYFCIDESPFWLVDKKRYDEAKLVLLKMAKLNKSKMKKGDIDSFFLININPNASSTNQSDSSVPEVNIKPTFFEIIKKVLKEKRVLRNTLIISYIFFAINLLFFGITLGSTSIDESINPYIIYTFQALSELIGNSLCLLASRFGYKKPCIIYMLITAVVCMIVGFIPKVNDTFSSNQILTNTVVIILLTTIGKISATAIFNSICVFSNELFEVEIRNFFINFFSGIGNIGGLISPQINLLGDFWAPLPYLIYSVSAFIGAVFFILLPESLKHLKKGFNIQRLFDYFNCI